jgi:hypothetical protein
MCDISLSGVVLNVAVHMYMTVKIYLHNGYRVNHSTFTNTSYLHSL